MSSRDPSRETIEVDLTIHVFSASATLVGVCLTVIGLFTISKRMSPIKTYGQDFLAVDSFLFLSSCIIAYIALTRRKSARMHFLEKCAERLFFLALSLMVVICGLIVYEYI